METIRHTFQQRQHMLLEDYELYHYRDSREPHVTLHFHDFYECLFLLSGNLRYQIDNSIVDLRPGEALLLNTNQLHRPLRSEGAAPYERFVLWLSTGFVKRLSTEKTDLSLCFEQAGPGAVRFGREGRGEVEERFNRLFKEDAALNAFGKDVACRGAVSELLVCLNRRSGQHPGRALPEESERADLANRVTSYLDAHMGEPLSLDAVAGEMFLSKFYLTRAFKEQTGTTIHQMLLQKRMIRARNLLFSGVNPLLTAEKCGFSDYSGFYKAFKTEYGMSPRAYLGMLRE